MIQSEGNVLNIGCGYPDENGIYEKRGNVGIDIIGGVADIIADAHHLPIRENTFSTVIIESALDHFHNPELALKEAKRVTQKNLIVMVQNPRFWQYIFAPDPDDHLYCWTLGVLSNLVRRSGFEIRTEAYQNVNANRTRRIRATIFEIIQTVLFGYRKTLPYRYDSYVIHATKRFSINEPESLGELR
jgi:SAM-dependent methyltransferase